MSAGWGEHEVGVEARTDDPQAGNARGDELADAVAGAEGSLNAALERVDIGGARDGRDEVEVGAGEVGAGAAGAYEVDDGLGEGFV